ncbi:MAG: thiamine pyrophosphate-binding protein, partial [Actinomycetota bacterium]|nr:thiamine pyrophosphate-binding protein [Actinomycetota bacterium]
MTQTPTSQTPTTQTAAQSRLSAAAPPAPQAQPAAFGPADRPVAPADRQQVPAVEYMTGAKSVVRSLEEAGVEIVFGIPGGAVLPVYDPLLDSEKVRHVLVRHEQGAGHAATGYAQASGRVGVCMATSGPGATNLVTPIADAH